MLAATATSGNHGPASPTRWTPLLGVQWGSAVRVPWRRRDSGEFVCTIGTIFGGGCEGSARKFDGGDPQLGGEKTTHTVGGLSALCRCMASTAMSGFEVEAVTSKYCEECRGLARFLFIGGV